MTHHPALAPMRLTQPLVWLLGLASILALSIGCWLNAASGIESDLYAQASGVFGGPEINDPALGGIDVAVSGRDLILTGEVPNEASRTAALASARGVPGVARVIDRLTVAEGGDAAAPGASGAFRISSGADGGLVVRGEVPSEAARAAILARLRADMPGRAIRDEMTVASGALTDWEPSMMAALPLLGDVEGASLTADGGQIVLRGTVASEAVKARVEGAARAAVLAPYAFRSELRVAPEADDASGGQVAASGSTDENVQGAEAALREALSLGAVEFESGTATLTARSREILNEAGAVFARFPSVAAEVQGHTDSEGDDAANQALSQQRAEAVETYLVGQGASGDQLSPRGYGESEPTADNSTAEGRARNRRVVFSLRSL